MPDNPHNSLRKRRDRRDTVVREQSPSSLRIVVPLLMLLVVVLGAPLLLVLDGDTETDVPDGSEDVQTDDGLTHIDEQTQEDSDGVSPDTGRSTDVRGEDVSEVNESRLETVLHHAVNEERLERGLGELRLSEELSETARNHSRNMSESGYVGHVDPSGEDVVRYREDCRELSNLGNLSYSENIARSWFGEDVVPPEGGEPLPVESETDLMENMVGEWLASDWHRENMLNDEWHSTGIGVSSNETGAVFATQAFCSRGG